ncbi:hypothetical protein CC80DRAFT_124258 [Byssothecium circinans]|uniref:Uncharacterized protein n=1 Tax=Byssothecium circinans TaxID=147558 RepID=A0A6A5TRK4_9PLEO|nr:hypothetical protein CC80DRAFT_124258 [Byssothecium circinans]
MRTDATRIAARIATRIATCIAMIAVAHYFQTLRTKSLTASQLMTEGSIPANTFLRPKAPEVFSDSSRHLHCPQQITHCSIYPGIVPHVYSRFFDIIPSFTH